MSLALPLPLPAAGACHGFGAKCLALRARCVATALSWRAWLAAARSGAIGGPAPPEVALVRLAVMAMLLLVVRLRR